MPPKKKSEKNPYVAYTPEDVVRAEAGSYTIQVIDDFFMTEEGNMAFSRERAEHFYGLIIDGCRDMIKNGDALEKEDAQKTLWFLKMMPLRIN